MHRYAELVYIWIFWVVDSECWLWIWTYPVNLSLIWIATEPVITLLLLSICDSTAAFSHLRVVPVRGLAVVHRLAAFGAAWSTNESHRKRTVRGEPDGWDPRGPWSHARKVPPYSAEKMFPPPDSWDPPAVSSHGRKCLLVLRKKLFIPLTAGTRQIWWLTCGPTKRTCTHGFVNLINKWF